MSPILQQNFVLFLYKNVVDFDFSHKTLSYLFTFLALVWHVFKE